MTFFAFPGVPPAFSIAASFSRPKPPASPRAPALIAARRVERAAVEKDRGVRKSDDMAAVGAVNVAESVAKRRQRLKPSLTRYRAGLMAMDCVQPCCRYEVWQPCCRGGACDPSCSVEPPACGSFKGTSKPGSTASRAGLEKAAAGLQQSKGASVRLAKFHYIRPLITGD